MRMSQLKNDEFDLLIWSAGKQSSNPTLEYFSSNAAIDQSMTYVPLIIHTLRIMLVRYIPAKFDITETTNSNTASYLDLLQSGRDFRSRDFKCRHDRKT